jgi:hypothetical protein
MLKMVIFKRPLLYGAVVVYILAGFSTLVVGERLGGMLFDEDGYFENMGAFGLFVTSFVFAYGLVKISKMRPATLFFRLRQLILLGCALVAFFGAGEEISWGQRIFNWQTPTAMNQINDQGETNVHNIVVLGHDLPFERAFDAFWMSLTVLLPLATMYIRPLRALVGRFFSVPHLGVGFLFLCNYLWAKVAEPLFQSGYVYSQVPYIQAVQEIKESNYELLFVLAALSIVSASLLECAQPDPQTAAGT